MLISCSGTQQLNS